jgi:hypothetical protein
MSVSTRVPAGRVNGNVVASGPVPAPRVVGNRRIRTGGVALAVMLLAFGAALSGIALLSVSRTSSYLAIGRPVQVGSQITAADLTTVQLHGGGGLTPIPATSISRVIGLNAAVSLVPGTLLVAADLTNKTLVGADQAQIGIHATNLPALRLHPGDQILLVPLGGSDKATGSTYTATVVDVGTIGNGGDTELHVAVPANLAPTLVTLNADGGLGIVLKAGN